MNQYTLKKDYYFEGKGLHTGKFAHLVICPAPADFGIRFLRSDCGVEIAALATNVSKTDRSTTISGSGVSVVTIEHLMSALTGLGVDNAIVKIDNEEMPILDGSADPYVKAIIADGLEDQGVERKYIDLKEEIEIHDEQSGSWVKLSPADKLSYEISVDFNSKVLGVQTASWDESMNYAEEIAPCRTFCFFHELEALVSYGLVKGGDVDNAIVVIEHPVSEEQIDNMCELFKQPKLKVTPEGYLSNLTLHFPNECGRHKLLDLIGDMRLAGGYIRAKISAYKPGHKINSNAAKAVIASI